MGPLRTAVTLAASLALLILVAAPAGAAAPSDSPRGDFFVLTQAGHDFGPSLRGAPISDNAGARQREQPLGRPDTSGGTPRKPGGGGGTSDGALQSSATTALGTTAGQSFDGVGVGLGSYSPIYTPPDTNAAVGATQIVQWVNADYAVFDKAGKLQAGPTSGNQVWAGFSAGNCNTNNDGDPIVKYDQLAGRWFMSQFSVSGGPPYYQCVAVSTGSDFLGAGGWNRYAFNFGNNFPDYPKFGVWPDAYYMSANLFWLGRSFNGGAACALDRNAMLAGKSATGQCFNLSSSYASPLPGDLDGTASPPAGAPGIFANFGSNSLNLWKMHVDFANRNNTTLTGPTNLAVAAFSKACGGGTCIPQAGTSQQLDSLGDRLMYRLSYRKFSTYESLLVNHSVKGSGTAAPRWYELRGSAGATGSWSVNQQSSYAPDATYRWMGSIAQDKKGNIAIGYSASSASISPQIRYTGRAANSTDSPGRLAAEVTVPLTTGSNTGPYDRWGDYSSMVVDPIDDCTFWYTTEYLKANGDSFSWSTRIVPFKFVSC